MKKSLWAIVAGVLVILVLTTVVDAVLHVVDVYPPMGQPMTDALALLASSYRIVIGIAGAWLTALLAPSNPMKHAMVLGAVGTYLAAVGWLATRDLGLAPAWYPVSLIVLAFPECWLGGKIHAGLSAKD